MAAQQKKSEVDVDASCNSEQMSTNDVPKVSGVLHYVHVRRSLRLVRRALHLAL